MQPDGRDFAITLAQLEQAEQREAMTSVNEQSAEAAQTEVVAFLSGWAGAGHRFTTHGAHVFVAGSEAIKIKRAVRYPYLDFSTLELRRRACERELEVNRANAPQLYLGVVAITREADGRLAIGGSGTPVEWAVRMRAFDQADLLGARAAAGELDPTAAKAVADAVFAAHARAPIAQGVNSAGRPGAVAVQLAAGFARHAAIFAESDRQAFERAAGAQLARARPCLARRAAAGCVRRVHGDLHLDNIVIWQGQPVLFDAIEFDEALATTDTLYDLAFLLMDLERRGRRLSANRVLNRYLRRAPSDLDLEGLAAMPLCLGLRAGVRALVAADKLRHAGSDADAGKRAEAKSALPRRSASSIRRGRAWSPLAVCRAPANRRSPPLSPPTSGHLRAPCTCGAMSSARRCWAWRRRKGSGPRPTPPRSTPASTRNCFAKRGWQRPPGMAW